MILFLDSNILYDDPFFKTIQSKVLFKAIDERTVTLCIASIVIQESKKNYLDKYEEYCSDLQKLSAKLKKIGINIGATEDISKIDPEFKWDTFYSELTQKGKICELQYDNNWLPEIVRRAIHRIKPFKKNGQEFRDCLIWLTYSNFMKTNDEKCDYAFITANSSDFCGEKKDCLHEELAREANNLKLYNSIRQFIDSEKESIGDYADYALEERIKEKITSIELVNIIEGNFKDVLEHYCTKYCEKIDEVNVDDEFSTLGYFNFDCLLQVDVEGEYTIEAFEGESQIEGNLQVVFAADGNVYNAVRDPGEDRYLPSGSKEFTIKARFTLMLNEDIKPLSLEVER